MIESWSGWKVAGAPPPSQARTETRALASLRHPDVGLASPPALLATIFSTTIESMVPLKIVDALPR